MVRRLSLAQWIIVAMVMGAVLGAVVPAASHPGIYAFIRSLSSIFLRLIKSLIAPLLFGTLVVGIAGHGGDMARVGRLAVRSIVYFEVVTTLALVIGLVAVRIAKPGVGVNLALSAAEQGQELAGTRVTLSGVLEHTVPQSFVDAAARNEVLQIVVFSILFAVALSRVGGRAQQVMLGFCESLTEVMARLTGLVMAYAPIGIGAAMGVTVGTNGIGVLRNLGQLVMTLYGALAAFILVVLLPVALVFRIPLRRFLATVQEPALIAFSTSSSEAALPRAIQAMEAMGVPRRIVGFVIPTGYSFNLDGSTLYLAVASIFAAQAAGIDLPLGSQLLLMLTLMLTSKGVAGVSRAALVILAGTLGQFGLPLQAVPVILGVDAVMDMGRTAVNVVGNCLASAVMARMEGEGLGAGEEGTGSGD